MCIRDSNYSRVRALGRSLKAGTSSRGWLVAKQRWPVKVSCSFSPTPNHQGPHSHVPALTLECINAREVWFKTNPSEPVHMPQPELHRSGACRGRRMHSHRRSRSEVQDGASVRDMVGFGWDQQRQKTQSMMNRRGADVAVPLKSEPQRGLRTTRSSNAGVATVRHICDSAHTCRLRNLSSLSY